MTAAVTPEPHVVVMGCFLSTPFAVKMRRSSSAGFNRPSSTSSVKGMLVAPGICPELMPGRGSGSVPAKRPFERASRTCACAAIICCIWEKSFTASEFSLARKVAGAR